MIQIKDLKPSDVGRWVEYTGNLNEKQLGRISSWNEIFIFVVYKCDGQWDKFQDYTADSTAPNNLKFTEALPDEWKKEKCECGHQFESADDYIIVGELKICWGCAENNQ